MILTAFMYLFYWFARRYWCGYYIMLHITLNFFDDLSITFVLQLLNELSIKFKYPLVKECLLNYVSEFLSWEERWELSSCSDDSFERDFEFFIEVSLSLFATCVWPYSFFGRIHVLIMRSSTPSSTWKYQPIIRFNREASLLDFEQASPTCDLI